MAEKRRDEDAKKVPAVIFDDTLTSIHQMSAPSVSLVEHRSPTHSTLLGSLAETPLTSVSSSYHADDVDLTPLDQSFLDATLTPSALSTPIPMSATRRVDQRGAVKVDFDHTLPGDLEMIGAQDQKLTKSITKDSSVDVSQDDLTTSLSPEEVILLRAHPQLIPEGFTVTIREHIGEGGTAIVDRATQNLLNRDVALKRLKSAAKKSSTAHFMLREAQLMAQLDHPNIPPIYQIAFDREGVPLILMKHVKGTSWDVLINHPHHDHWERHPSDQLRTHLEMLVKICFAVEYAHKKEIIHCDIKASNVMVGDFGEVFLLDWGFAIELNNVDQHRMKGFYGSPSFAAPEMFNVGSKLTKQTDVYLLGATLHQILTRNPFHKGNSLYEVVELARRSLKHDYPESIHPMLVQIIHKATDPDPHRRYANVSDFREALESHLNHYTMLDMVSEMREKLIELQQLLEQPSCNEFHFNELAFECRFGFKRALEAFPDDDKLKQDLCKTLMSQARYELTQNRLEMPPRLLEEIKVLGASSRDIASLDAEIQSAKLRSSELAVQIQYKLLEELQRAKQASSASSEPTDR